MKTPEEIKKGLGCHGGKDVRCGECYYRIASCRFETAQDALALTQKLEAQNAELLEKIKQLERERDAAIYDLKKARECRSCKHIDVVPSEQPCKSCGIHGKNYEWRGPCEENGGMVDD